MYMNYVDTRYDDLPQHIREVRLMETAMLINDAIRDLKEAGKLNRDAYDEMDSMELYSNIIAYTREFEEKYCGSEEYADEWLTICYQYAETVAKELFGLVQNGGN